MNLFVTGAAGFIGSHVCDYFIKLGNKVTGIDNFDPFYCEKLKQKNIEFLLENPFFNFKRGDIRDRYFLKEAFSNERFDAVIHLAAKAGVRPSIESIEEYYDVNINGTLCLLSEMKIAKIRKLLFASSSSVYGNNTKLPFSETDNVDNPISPYASTKKSGELLCYVYSHLFGFDITCLRFFTVYGPRQRPDLAIHKFTRLIDEGKPIPFYGDGTSSRDYTFIGDILQGIGSALNKLYGFNIYNLGGSKVVRLDHLVRAIEDLLGKKALINRLPFQQGDVITTYADIRKAKNDLGFEPKYDLNKGLQEFVTWYNDHKNFE